MKNDMNQQVVDFDNKIINNKDIKIILSILSIVNRWNRSIEFPGGMWNSIYPKTTGLDDN